MQKKFSMETWKSVDGYNGLYEVSSNGLVRSVLRKVWNPGRNCYRVQYPRVLRLTVDNNGYNRVTLSKEGKIKQHLVHRLVAEAFIPNPKNLPQINHINEVTSDNRIENLEWCTNEYNCNYGNHNSNISKSQSIPVLQYTLEGKFIREWQSSREAESETGIANTNILRCCHGGFYSKKRKVWVNVNKANGFIWKFK